MDRKLIDYLPPVLRDVAEMQVINEANEPELSLAWDGLARVMANQFLEDADEHGVSIWEKELGLYPKDTESLEERKLRVKAMWGLELPYTLTWLKNWVGGLCTGGGHTETVEDYTITVQIDGTRLGNFQNIDRELFTLLSKVRPANMVISTETLIQAAMLSHHAPHAGAYIELWGRDAQQADMATAFGLHGGAIIEIWCA